MNPRIRPFERVYVEDAARDHPGTKRVLEQLASSRVIGIDHYKDLFNRPRQDWRAQKKTPSLILARRREDFLYDASAYTPDFGHPRFFYNALALNCVYDCGYCYLQGMFPGAHVTLFVNNEDYLAAAEEALREGPLYLALSYDTDLLTFEHLLPHAREWLAFARERPGLTVEIRTKSSRYNLLRNIRPLPNAVLAWTLSPQPVIDRHEAMTPSLKHRLRAASMAMADGWPVRICIDPILRVPDWETVYSDFIDELAAALDLSMALDFSLGVFRINKDYLKNMKQRAAPSAILHYPYQTTNGLATYPQVLRDDMIGLVRERLRRHVGEERIFVT